MRALVLIAIVVMGLIAGYKHGIAVQNCTAKKAVMIEEILAKY